MTPDVTPDLIRQIIREELSSATGDEVMDAEQVAAILKLNYQTVCRMAREKGIPAARAGKEWRFSRNAVMAWLSSRRAA